MSKIAISRRAREQTRPVLAWTAWGFAVVGGTLAVGTGPGHLVAWVLRLVPWSWMLAVVLAAAVVATAVDLLMDGVPDRVAVWTTLATPTIAAAAPGRLGHTITGWCTDLLAWISHPLSVWLGTASSEGLAISCVVIAAILVRRTVAGGPSRTRAA